MKIADIPSKVLFALQDNYKVEEIEAMTPEEVFEHWLEWEGIIGWSGTILEVLKKLGIIK